MAVFERVNVPDSKQRGLSLIELMIALALGVILTLGVTQIFLGSNQTYRLTDGLSLVQENMRFALGNLQYNGRMAGHYGCLVGDPANNLNTSDPNYDPDVYDAKAVAAMGWEASGTSLGTTFTISSLAASSDDALWSNGTTTDFPDDLSGKVIPGTDVVVFNGGAEVEFDLSGNPSSSGNTIVTKERSGIPSGTIIMAVASDCSGGDLYQNTNSKNNKSLVKGGSQVEGSPGNASPIGQDFKSGVVYDSDATVLVFSSTAYYIGESDSGQPALFRDRLDSGDQFNRVELVEGVENMQVLYGVADNIDANPRADSYVPASSVNDWGQVVSVRIALLMRAGDNIIDEPAANTYNLIGTQVTTESDRRARLLGSATVAIRNRLE